MCCFSSSIRNLLAPEKVGSDKDEVDAGEVSDFVIEEASRNLSSTGHFPFLSFSCPIWHTRWTITPGFINYYGTQRFGTGEIPTHEASLRKQFSTQASKVSLSFCWQIGKALIKEDFQGAIAMILAPRFVTCLRTSWTLCSCSFSWILLSRITENNEEIKKAREYFARTRDAKGAYQLFPR